ncbi:GNAT family N-acetyltransferase [Mesoterricola sediminis]|uniref:N-acetyltransferase domain-containing protein n=1 Tax=Mesoterricola sediminis TaxID=2927980 RepID=A0AA48H577_9BACT|nr:GNAT family N-acetyltransferase [Mesoterricola sediminis]BDU77626.1 hypothetical protein METESE_25840 [Mesoterricola sediminis]
MAAIQQHVRPAVAADAEALTRLAIAFRDHLQRATPTEAAFREAIAQLLAAPDALFLLAETADGPAGYVLLRFRLSMWAGGLDATLEDLYVDPAHRGRGVGRDLVGAALMAARERGAVTVGLDTNERNEASNRIYASFGFSGHSKRWDGRQVFLRLTL